MRLSLLYCVVFLFLLTDCESPPRAVEPEPLPAVTPPPETDSVAEPIPEPEHLEYDQTLVEVKQFIEILNRIIADKNYNAWINALSDAYYARISSPEYLQRQSESPLLTSRKIVLRTARDFFLYVVVPSRANSQVDEIEIDADNAVTAFFVDTRPGRGRLRVYELRKIGNDWKIVE